MIRMVTNVALVLLIATTAFFAGLQFGGGVPTQAGELFNFGGVSSTQPKDVDFSMFWKAYNLLENKFVPAGTSTAVTDEEKVWGAIEGLAAAYGDPYTVFLPPSDSALFEEDISGSFGGAGMEIGAVDGMLTVIAPLKGTPADNAGIRSGDRIVRIDGEFTEKLSVDEAVMKIRGEIGTEVKLDIAREGETELIEVTIVRSTIKIPTIEAQLRSDNVFVIALFNFGATAPNEFRAALRQFVLSGSDKLILDLRGNPGGFLEAAVDVTSWFLPAGKTVVIEHFGDEQEEILHRSKGYNIYKPSWKVAVLVDQGSASASEIVAGALAEHDIATLIGETTFGKGSVQELVKVTPETSIKITIARWLTPNGTSISDGGLTPEIVVEVTPEDIEANRDPQLERAVEFLNTGQ